MDTIPAGYWQSTKAGQQQKEAASTVARCISSALKISYGDAYRRVTTSESSGTVIDTGRVSYRFIRA